MSSTIGTEPAVESHSSGIIPVFNPSTEEQIAEVVDSDQAAVDAAVARARPVLLISSTVLKLRDVSTNEPQDDRRDRTHRKLE